MVVWCFTSFSKCLWEPHTILITAHIPNTSSLFSAAFININLFSYSFIALYCYLGWPKFDLLLPSFLRNLSAMKKELPVALLEDSREVRTLTYTAILVTAVPGLITTAVNMQRAFCARPACVQNEMLPYVYMGMLLLSAVIVFLFFKACSSYRGWVKLKHASKLHNSMITKFAGPLLLSRICTFSGLQISSVGHFQRDLCVDYLRLLHHELCCIQSHIVGFSSMRELITACRYMPVRFDCFPSLSVKRNIHFKSYIVYSLLPVH